MKLSKKLRASLPKHDNCMGFKSGELGESFADSSRAAIVEWHVLRAQQSPMHLAESVTPSGSSQLQTAESHASRWICHSVRQQSVADSRVPCISLNLSLRPAAVSCRQQSPMHLAESVTPSGSSQLQSSIYFGSINLKKALSITVCKNISTKITLQWHHCRVKLVSLVVEMNEN